MPVPGKGLQRRRKVLSRGRLQLVWMSSNRGTNMYRQEMLSGRKWVLFHALNYYRFIAFKIKSNQVYKHSKKSKFLSFIFLNARFRLKETPTLLFLHFNSKPLKEFFLIARNQDLYYFIIINQNFPYNSLCTFGKDLQTRQHVFSGR